MTTTRLQKLFEETPTRLLHLFACDCAQRALMREREAGREPDPRSWRALRTKRLWLEGEASFAQLNSVWDAAWDARNDAIQDSYNFYDDEFWGEDESRSKEDRWAAARAAVWAAGDSRATALEAIKAATKDESDETWQSARLSWLHKTYEDKGDHLLFLLREGEIDEPENVQIKV